MKIVMIILILYSCIVLLMPMYIRNHVKNTSLLKGYGVNCLIATFALIYAIVFAIFATYSTLFAKEKIDILTFLNGGNQKLQISTIALFAIFIVSLIYCIIHIVLHSKYLKENDIPTLSAIAMHFFMSITCYVSLPILFLYLFISTTIKRIKDSRRQKRLMYKVLLPIIIYSNTQKELVGETNGGSEDEKKAV